MRNPRRFLLSRCALPVFALMACAVLAHGQSTSWARLVGTVTDPSGAVVPGADVTAVHKETNIAHKAVTNERGDYLIDKMRPGLYDVSVEMSGFKKQAFLAVRLQTEQVGRVDFVLTTGQISETVEVTGVSPIINTERAEIGSVVEEKKIRELPLRGRDVTKLAFLTTGGTQEAQDVGLITQVVTYGGGTPAFNGMYSHSNSVQLDGSNNTMYSDSRMAVTPTPETIQEFKLVTNNYSAEYGKTGGAIISMSSKSGANELHADAWYYFRNETFDSSRFFDNRVARGKLPVDYKIFGGAVGGPIFKNRTFFYGNYEHFIDDSSITTFATVPSLRRRGGDFSVADGPFAQTQLYDPYNVVDGQRVAFPGNIIPASRINPISAKLMQLLPIPAPNVSGTNANNFSYGRTVTSRINKWSTRIDHHFSGGSTLFGRINWQETPSIQHTSAIGAPGMLAGVYQQYVEPTGGFNMAGGWVKPFGANLVSELNLVGSKSRRVTSRSIDFENWEEKLGFDTASAYKITNADGSRGPGGMPRVSPSGYMAWGPGAAGQEREEWGVEAKYSLAWKKGNHYLKFGIGHIQNRGVGFRLIPQGVGSTGFDGYATGQVTRNAAGAITGATLGDPFADFLLGAPASFAGNIAGGFGYGYTGGEGSFNQSHYSAFVQDEWKVSRDLSLSIGLRWEQARPPFYNGSRDGSYKSGYYYCGIDVSPGRWNPIQWFPESFDITKWAGGDLSKTSIPYKNLSDEGCYTPHWSYFQPRFGLAWKMFGTNRTVLRIGAGRSIDTEFGALRARLLTTNIGEVSVNQTRGQAPSITFGAFKSLPTLAATSEYRSCYYNEMDWQEGSVYSYNLTIQHEIFRGTMVEVGYVGNQARHLRNVMPFNMALPQGYDKVRLFDGTAQPISSAAVTLPGSSVVFTGQRARRPYPQLVANVMMQPDGSMHYDSLQAKVERRFASGWALASGYTWSKAFGLNFNGNWLDTVVGGRWYQRDQLRGPTLYDRTHTYYSSLVWELPFFTRSNGLVRTFLGGWEVANITTLTSGQTFPVSIGIDILDLGSRYNSWPDRIADGALPKGERTVDRFFDTKAFACASPLCPNVIPIASNFGLGNSSIRPLRGAAVPLTDFSLHKQFHIRERQTFDFRVDMFNAFNHPVFQLPNGAMGTAAAGRVTDTAAPRQIMFGFRYSF